MPESKDNSHWNRYWRADRVASCFDRDSNSYDNSIGKIWRTFFESIPNESSVLDIATGNGAIPIMALEQAEEDGKTLHVTGIDRADIAPDEFSSSFAEMLSKVKFFPNTNAEALPFEQSSFDVVVSNFGLEYCNIGAVLEEIRRVLKSGGRCQFLMHAREGSVARAAKEHVMKGRVLIEELKLPRRALTAIKHCLAVERGLATKNSDHIKAQKAVARFEVSLKGFQDLKQAGETLPFMDHAASVCFHTFQVRPHHSEEDLVAKVKEVEAELIAHISRNSELFEAALSKQSASNLKDELSRGDFVSVELSEFKHPEAGFCAWRLSALRS